MLAENQGQLSEDNRVHTYGHACQVMSIGAASTGMYTLVRGSTLTLWTSIDDPWHRERKVNPIPPRQFLLQESEGRIFLFDLAENSHFGHC